MKFKRICALITVLVVVLSLFSGCGKAPAAESSVSTQAASSAAPTATDAKELAKPDVIKILAQYSDFDPNADADKLEIDKLTGYNTKWFMLPQDKPMEKLMIELSAGADYDIIRLSDISQLGKIVKMGKALALNDLLAKYGQNVIKAYEPSPDIMKQVTIDGTIYGIPTKKLPGFIMSTLQYRKDIADKLGLKSPETPAELKTMLETIKAKENVIPLVSMLDGYGTSGVIIDTIASAFGLLNYWKDVNGELVPLPKQPGMKDYLKYMTELYNAGLIDKELPAMTNEAKLQKYTSGKAFMCYFMWPDWQGLEPMRKTVPNSQVEYVSSLKDTSGNRITKLYSPGAHYLQFVNSTSKYPEQCIDFLDKLAINSDVITNGTEGVHYTAKDGSFIPTEAYTKERGKSWWFLTVSPIDLVDKTSTLSNMGQPKDCNDVYVGLMKSCSPYGMADPTEFEGTPDAKAKYFLALQKLESDFYVKVVAGAESLDSYDKFIQTWESEGGSQLIKEVNELHNQNK
jgi:putative aldouronate transport system substrate-binding protein